MIVVVVVRTAAVAKITTAVAVTVALQKVKKVKKNPKAKRETKKTKYSNVKKKANFQFVTTADVITCARKMENRSIGERLKNASQEMSSIRTRKSAWMLIVTNANLFPLK